MELSLLFLLSIVPAVLSQTIWDIVGQFYASAGLLPTTIVGDNMESTVPFHVTEACTYHLPNTWTYRGCEYCSRPNHGVSTDGRFWCHPQ